MAGRRQNLPRGKQDVGRHRQGDPEQQERGDLAIFLITKGVKPEDLVNLPLNGFPESVIDLLSEISATKGGWPKAVQKVILGGRKPLRGRPGASAKKSI